MATTSDGDNEDEPGKDGATEAPAPTFTTPNHPEEPTHNRHTAAAATTATARKSAAASPSGAINPDGKEGTGVSSGSATARCQGSATYCRTREADQVPAELVGADASPRSISMKNMSSPAYAFPTRSAYMDRRGVATISGSIPTPAVDKSEGPAHLPPRPEETEKRPLKGAIENSPGSDAHATVRPGPTTPGGNSEEDQAVRRNSMAVSAAPAQGIGIALGGAEVEPVYRIDERVLPQPKVSAHGGRWDEKMQRSRRGIRVVIELPELVEGKDEDQGLDGRGGGGSGGAQEVQGERKRGGSEGGGECPSSGGGAHGGDKAIGDIAGMIGDGDLCREAPEAKRVSAEGTASFLPRGNENACASKSGARGDKDGICGNGGEGGGSQRGRRMKASLQDVELDVLPRSLDVRVPGVYRLRLQLPFAVDADDITAKFRKTRATLTVSAKEA